MRQIKFRGREKSSGNIIYGFYYNLITSTYNPWNNPLDKDEYEEKYTEHYIVFISPGDWGLPHFLHKREVFSNVEEFTGLLDKNGKEVYEGDLINGSKVVFKDGQFITESGIRDFENYEVEENPCEA